MRTYPREANPCPVCGQPEDGKYRPFCGEACSNVDLNQVRAELLGDLERLAETLLGEPSLRKPRTWRWGNRGSLSLELRGHKRGTWHSFEANEGGGPFHLIMHARSGSMAEAIQWARDWAGKTENRRPRPLITPCVGPREAADDADEARRILIARHLWERSRTAAETVAAIYLTGPRAIPAPASGWPDAVRFHEPTCSLILAATLTDGTVQAVQRVRLTPEGQKVEGAPDQPAKVTNGVLAGAMVRLPGDPAGPLLLAEGPEAGLSIWVATGHETWIALGSIAKATPPTGRTVVIARDDDAAWSPADRKLREQVKAWQAAGIKVVVAAPWPERRGDKSDFNDVIQAGGVAAVQAQIEAALAPSVKVPLRKPVGEARHIIGAAVARFFGAAAEHVPAAGVQPPVHAARVDVGVGKSLAARRGAAELLLGMRVQGDNRTVVFAVPTHALGEEAAVEFEAMPAARTAHLTAQIWRGREAADPDAPGELMCRDLDRVRDAQDAGQAVQTSCCESKDVCCPFFHSCGYQAQRRLKANIWFVAHEMLFTECPSAIGKVAAVIVDESAWQDGLEGDQGRPIALALDTLDVHDSVPGDGLSSQRLRSLRLLALEALRGAEDGPAPREVMQAVGMTADGAAEARKLEWMRKVDVGMHPAMTIAERKAAVRAAEGNRTIRRLAMFWRAIETLLQDDGPKASGWAALDWADTKEGPVRALHLKGRKLVRKGWQVPTLLIDATLNINLVRPFWPNVKMVADVAAEAPHQHLWQVTDRSYSKRHLELHDELTEDERRIRTRHLRNLNATLAAIGRSYAPGRTLVVGQKVVKEALPVVGMLPPSIELAHHNAVAGRDGWKGVAALVVVGRTAPSPASVARIAEALTGSAALLLTGWYPKVASGREMANGDHVAAECDRHPDPICEAIRWHICEGELVQIIGRARGVNRTASDPVNILVMTDAPLPLPLDRTLNAADLTPSPAEVMLGTGGVAFENAADAAAVYPQIWTRAAAKHALERTRLVPNPYRKLFIREWHQPLCPVTYQVAGPGRSRSMAWVDLLLVPDPAAWLEQRLGLLAWCQPAPVHAKPAAPPPSVDGYGERLAPDAMFASVPSAAPMVGLWTVKRLGMAPLAITEASTGDVSVLPAEIGAADAWLQATLGRPPPLTTGLR